MEESFNLVAQSRVNYFTPGSPVQVVRVELLQGSESKENAVCLTFKNIRETVLTALKVHFKCKGTNGEILYEDEFTYEDLNAENGVLFGMDDAVFVTQDEIASIDVSLLRAWYGRKSEDLTEYERVRLPAPKKLPKDVAASLQAQSGRKGMKYMPQVLENGWYCACGAFHANEENTVYCSECGSDRILLQNAISGILFQEEPAAPAAANGEEPTQVVAEHRSAADRSDAGRTRVVEQTPKQRVQQPRPYQGAEPLTEEEEEMYEDPRDVLAEKLIRWVPAVTAVLCAVIAVGGFVYCKLFL